VIHCAALVQHLWCDQNLWCDQKSMFNQTLGSVGCSSGSGGGACSSQVSVACCISELGTRSQFSSQFESHRLRLALCFGREDLASSSSLPAHELMQSIIGPTTAIVATQALEQEISQHLMSDMDHSPLNVMMHRWSNSVHLIVCSMQHDSRDCRLENLFAVKLTQPITEPKCPRFVEQAVSTVCKKPGFERASCVQLSHYTGGSDTEGELMCCIVLGGDGCGWTVDCYLENAIQLAMERQCGRVLCYWGSESWTRELLLKQISRGRFATCRGNVGDLTSPPEECWKNALGRCT
jgi:hypothetical protein